MAFLMSIPGIGQIFSRPLKICLQLQDFTVTVLTKIVNPLITFGIRSE